MAKLEFQVFKDIYREKIVDGEPKEYCVKRDALVNWTCFDHKDITDVREMLTARGKPQADRCTIYSQRHDGWFLVKGSYYEVNEQLANAAVTDSTKIKGFS
jgi:hypothetical protein